MSEPLSEARLQAIREDADLYLRFKDFHPVATDYAPRAVRHIPALLAEVARLRKAKDLLDAIIGNECVSLDHEVQYWELFPKENP